MRMARNPGHVTVKGDFGGILRGQNMQRFILFCNKKNVVAYMHV